MTTTRRSKGSTAAGATVNASHHVMGLVAQSPLMLIFLIIGLGIAVWIFTLAQITNTEQSVFGLLQVSTQLAPGMTGAQVQQFMNGHMDYYNGIAAIIGWGVQIALLMISFPPDSALFSIH